MDAGDRYIEDFQKREEKAKLPLFFKTPLYT